MSETISGCFRKNTIREQSGSSEIFRRHFRMSHSLIPHSFWAASRCRRASGDVRDEFVVQSQRHWFVLALQLIKRLLQDFEKKISVLFMHTH